MLSAQQAAQKWGCTAGRVRQLAQAGSIRGAVKLGRDWVIPDRAKNPLRPRSAQADKIVSQTTGADGA